MSSHRTAATRPLRRATLWIVITSLLLVACEQVTSPDYSEPAERINYDRQQVFDIVPIDSTSDYIGWFSLYGGPTECGTTMDMYGYDVGVTGQAGADTTDTLTFDLWIITRCPGPWGVYSELRIFLDTRHPAFPDSHALTVSYGLPRQTSETRRIILHHSKVDFLPEPYAECVIPQQLRRVPVSPPIQIPPIQTCRKTGEPDSLRLTIRIEPPWTREPFARGPDWIPLGIELTDIDSGRSVTTSHLFTLRSL